MNDRKQTNIMTGYRKYKREISGLLLTPIVLLFFTGAPLKSNTDNALLAPGPAFIFASNTPLRKRAHTKAPVLARLKPGEKVEIKIAANRIFRLNARHNSWQTIDRWYRVRARGRTGYVRGRFIARSGLSADLDSDGRLEFLLLGVARNINFPEKNPLESRLRVVRGGLVQGELGPFAGEMAPRLELKRLSTYTGAPHFVLIKSFYTDDKDRDRIDEELILFHKNRLRTILSPEENPGRENCQSQVRFPEKDNLILVRRHCLRRFITPDGMGEEEIQGDSREFTFQWDGASLRLLNERTLTSHSFSENSRGKGTKPEVRPDVWKNDVELAPGD